MDEALAATQMADGGSDGADKIDEGINGIGRGERRERDREEDDEEIGSKEREGERRADGGWMGSGAKSREAQAALLWV